MKYSAQDLQDHKPEFDFFIGIDSDGCVFDSMELKHKECFIPAGVKVWGLQPIAKYFREAAEFVNLYSVYRGINRFPGLVKVFELLKDRKEVNDLGFEIPNLDPLSEFINSGMSLGNDSLKTFIQDKNDPILDKTMEWSLEVNKNVTYMVEGLPPFPSAIGAMKIMSSKADNVVVSSTPAEALIREWADNDIEQYVKVIAGQEMGNKNKHLTLAAKDKYKEKNILMIGDAPGDMNAAKSINALFFPINPGAEEKSWKILLENGLPKFFEGSFSGDYEDNLIENFKKLLPENPEW